MHGSCSVRKGDDTNFVQCVNLGSSLERHQWFRMLGAWAVDLVLWFLALWATRTSAPVHWGSNTSPKVLDIDAQVQLNIHQLLGKKWASLPKHHEIFSLKKILHIFSWEHRVLRIAHIKEPSKSLQKIAKIYKKQKHKKALLDKRWVVFSPSANIL